MITLEEKRMQTLLIVDTSPLFADLLARPVKDSFRVYTCADGDTALELLEKLHPDVLVLQLCLPGRDGFTLLRSLSRRPPVILGLTNLTSAYIEQTAARLGISCLLRAPSVHSLAMALLELTQSAQGCTPELLLQDLGFTPNTDGFRYLSIGLPLFCEDPDQSVCKELYPKIACLAAVKDGTLVERSIRSAISTAWQRRDSLLWSSYFPNGQKAPSNKVFLATLVQKLKKDGL